MNFANHNMKEALLFIYAFLNLVVFLLYALDKYKAMHKRWRIPEKTLLLAAVLGAFGALLGMYVLHHKTRKPKFFVTVPLILLCEVGCMIWYYLKFAGPFS